MTRVILISACLVGENTRYDGTNKYQPSPLPWPDSFTIMPVCPEVACGLSVPREPMRLVKRTSLSIENLTSTQDYTERFYHWLYDTEELFPPILHGAILKERSPSCGLSTPFYDSAGTMLGNTNGLFAQFLSMRYPNAILATEEALFSAYAMQKFIDQTAQLA